MALWYLYQTSKIAQPSNIGDSYYQEVREDDKQEQFEDTSGGLIHDENYQLDTIIYPPKSEEIVSKMINYMLALKTFPYPAPEWLKTLQLNEIPMSLRPAKNNCQDCQNTLSGPYRITQRAKILAMQGYIEGVERYIKLCNECKNFFRYQEYSDGVHNFSDVFLLVIDVCIFLRHFVKNNVAIGSFCDAIQEIFDSRVASSKVTNAYIHFESLSQRHHEFFCIRC